MDIYADRFTRSNLLTSFAKAPYIPGTVGGMGIFRTEKLTSTVFEAEAGALDSVTETTTAMPRGAPPKPLDLAKRVVVPFTTATYAYSQPVMADSILASRGYSPSVTAETMQNRLDRAMMQLRNQADMQHEYLRVACLNSATNDFGTSPVAAVVAFGASDTSAIRTAVHLYIRLPMEAALAGIPYTGMVGFCSETYWQAFIASATVAKAYEGWQAAMQLHKPSPDMFEYQNVLWTRVRETTNTKITSGQAKVVPMGVPNMFVQAFAPNDTVDEVARPGEPYYLHSEPIRTSAGIKGYEVTLQTHPVMVCTRPDAVITVDLS